MKTPTHSVRTRLLRTGYALALTTMLAATGLAQSVEERLAALERQVTELKTENAALKKDLGYTRKADASKDAPLTVAPILVRPGGKETKLALGGFIHANAEMGDAPDARWNGIRDRFLLRRARLNVTATFAEHFSGKIEADFGANTLSSSSAIRAQLTDGFVQWSKYSEATVRVGQFKTPFGYEQLASDTKIFTIERSLPSDRLTASRQIGAAVSGEVMNQKLNYSVGAFNGTSVNTSVNDNDEFMWAGRLGAIVFDAEFAGQKSKVTAGINGFTTEDTGSGFTGRRDAFGFDAQVAIGRAEVWGEWLQSRNDPASGATVKADGYSLLAVWKFTSQWQGLVRRESYDSNTALPGTTTELWTLGFNYLLKGDDLKLSLNYLLGDQPGSTPDGNRVLCRMQVVF